MSLLAKLFGRQKKKSTAPSPSKDLEYTTFSAQFPPPEWNWYQQQQDKHHRTERWVTDQMVKSRTWHHMPQRPGCAANGQGKTDQTIGGPLRQRSATLAVTGSHHFRLEKLPPSSRETWRLEADGNSETPAIDSKQVHNMETRMETNDKPRHKSPPPSFLAEDAGNIQYPVYPMQSTPIMSNNPHISRPPNDCPGKHPHQSNRSDNPTLSANSYNNFSKKAYKAKKKLQKLREHHTDYYGNDISIEYKGKMLGYSRDSGVNCIGQAPLKSAPEAIGQSVAKQKVSTENVPNDFAMPEDRLHNGYGAALGKSNSLRQRSQHKHSGHKYQRHSNIYENIPATFVNDNPEPVITEHNTENKADEKNYPDIIQRAPSIGSDSQGGKSSVQGSSEKSFNTVIAVKALVHSGPMEHLVKETKDLNLGDSGFSSPRFAEGSSGVVNANFMKSREKSVIQNHLKNSNKENIDGEHANNKNLWTQPFDPAASQNNGQLESPLNNQNYRSNSKQKTHPELIYQGSQNDLQGQGQKEAYNGRKFDFNADYEVVGVV